MRRHSVLLILVIVAFGVPLASLTSRSTIRSAQALPPLTGERGRAAVAPLTLARGTAKNAARPTLLPIEAAIARQPFAPKAARLRLVRAVADEAPSKLAKQRRGMGWAQPDPEYWRHIPPPARQIPRDWSELPVVRFTNTEIGGAREVRLRRGREYDQWLLLDPLHHLTACISVQRMTRRVYFMQIARQRDGKWGLAVSDDRCYSCHASGPRVIRPLNEPRVDQRTLARFNRLILSYGACDFGDSVDATMRYPLENASCVGCHDGVRRGRLYDVHRRPMLFKTEKEETMPPSSLTASNLGEEKVRVR